MADQRPHLLTKIIATVGPACLDVAKLARMIEEGVRVFRINFSHGSFEGFEQARSLVRQASEYTGVDAAILGDLCGPKIRVGKVRDGGINCAAGDIIEFQKPEIVAGSEGLDEPPRADGSDAQRIRLSTTFPPIIDDVRAGHRLLINDGHIRALVTEKTGDGDDAILHARVTHGGLITSAKGINLPDSDLTTPSITDYDWKSAAWAVENDLDFIALSFVRKAEDVRELREFLKQQSKAHDLEKTPPIIAKIEMPQALAQIERIVDAADGIMVARGDLGVEMDLAEVPGIQKRLVRQAHDYGKPCIVATQMLESVIENATPTRAEVSDVANAILDGADAVMLSGETAVGAHPIVAVNLMARIAAKTEDYRREMLGQSNFARETPKHMHETRYRTAALANGVAVVTRDLHAKMIVIWSQGGGGARYLSQHRPTVPIIAFTSDHRAARRMGLMYAVQPVVRTPPQYIEQFVAEADEYLRSRQWGGEGDPVVFVVGSPIGTEGVTNKLRIHYLGDICRVEW